MGLTSISLPYPHAGDPEFPTGRPMKLDRDPSRWLVDEDGLVGSGANSFSETESIVQSLNPDDTRIRLEAGLGNGKGFEGIVGQSPALLQVLRLIETVAASDSSVLLLGETGTGKELIARAIHNRSLRKQRNLVKLNCAAIPTGLLESELFGHERGAFTGAIAQQIGRLELADRGSLFLDEIGDIPLELQPKLLRVLQEREFERLGSNRTLKVDVRVIAATHRDLETMIEEKLFRSDLYYRLNVFPIVIPPLRERPEDILLLARHFVQRASRKMNKLVDTIPRETLGALTRYPWPGNIRELENVIERAVILSNGRDLQVPPGDLRCRIAPVQNDEKNLTLEEVERNHILMTLKATRWVVSGPRGAAARLGLKRQTLNFRMKKLGIMRPGTEPWRHEISSGTGRVAHPGILVGELP